MKKYIIIFLSVLLLTSCKTQEEIKEETKQKEINKITEEINKEVISEESKKWLIDTKTKKVTTILCLSTSKKCNELEETVENIKKENNIIIHLYYLDKLDENTTNILKTTYELKDYTGYTPYIFVTEKKKLLFTKVDMNNEELEKYLIEKEIIDDKK